MLNLIPDGYTETGYIAEEPRVHGELRFTYRPMLAEERDGIDKACRNLTVAQQHANYRKVLVAKLKSWDMTDQKGNAAEITDANIRIMRPVLFDRLYNVVAGYRASDVEKSGSDEGGNIDHLLEAASLGAPFGLVTELADEKN